MRRQPGGGQGIPGHVEIEPVGDGLRAGGQFVQKLGFLVGQDRQDVVVALFEEVAGQIAHVVEHLAAEAEVH